MEGIRDGEEMSIKDNLYLSPFEKYKLYGLFPWKFAISILILFLTTAQVILIVNINSNYSYQQIILWNNLFLNKESSGSDTSLTNTFNIFDYSTLKNYISDNVDVIKN
jgi:hypothetical protein